MRRQKGNRLLFPVFEKKDACKKRDSKKKGQLLFSVFEKNAWAEKGDRLLFSVFEKRCLSPFWYTQKK